jgi:hypothetical protein
VTRPATRSTCESGLNDDRVFPAEDDAPRRSDATGISARDGFPAPRSEEQLASDSVRGEGASKTARLVGDDHERHDPDEDHDDSADRPDLALPPPFSRPRPARASLPERELGLADATRARSPFRGRDRRGHALVDLPGLEVFRVSVSVHSNSNPDWRESQLARSREGSRYDGLGEAILTAKPGDLTPPDAGVSSLRPARGRWLA